MDHAAAVCDWGPRPALRLTCQFVPLVTGQIPRHLHGHNPLQGHQPCLLRSRIETSKWHCVHKEADRPCCYEDANEQRQRAC